MPFESHLELRHRPGHRRWEVILPLAYTTRDGRQIIVPIGALSDLASFPPVVRGVLDAQCPTAIHDYIYTHLTHRFTKQEADRIFYEALLEEGTRQALAWTMWQAVRIGGRGAWGQS
ncbi:hypothetical protein GCM10008969_58230 [Pseudomonas veronii subsp. inensis]|uniref:DUF1353 domain-containing protein n=1 Tax=Pseudomonas veronii TaxID=76761 RepID=UPI0031F9DE26